MREGNIKVRWSYDVLMLGEWKCRFRGRSEVGFSMVFKTNHRASRQSCWCCTFNYLSYSLISLEAIIIARLDLARLAPFDDSLIPRKKKKEKERAHDKTNKTQPYSKLPLT